MSYTTYLQKDDFSGFTYFHLNDPETTFNLEEKNLDIDPQTNNPAECVKIVSKNIVPSLDTNDTFNINLNLGFLCSKYHEFAVVSSYLLSDGEKFPCLIYHCYTKNNSNHSELVLNVFSPLSIVNSSSVVVYLKKIISV